jgi:hypothetical protein
MLAMFGFLPGDKTRGIEKFRALIGTGTTANPGELSVGLANNDAVHTMMLAALLYTACRDREFIVYLQ